MELGIKKSNPQVRPKLRTPGIVDEILRTVVFIIVVTVLFDMAVPRSLVDGRSMQQTFQDAERLIVSRVHYLITTPDRGDIIVFNSVDVSDPNVMLIKRVIGLPGDTVQFIDQNTYINGVQINEPYINEMCSTSRCPDKEVVLGEDEYFVMGDNRNNSRDSRVFGAVPIENVVGRVVFRYWPLPRIGIIQHQNYERLNP
ncbi:MAG: signal peptidase I [Phototrophicaceae bacterium]